MASRRDEHGRGGGAGSHPVLDFGTAGTRGIVGPLAALFCAALLGAGCRPDAADAGDAAASRAAAEATPLSAEDTMADTPSDSLRLDLVVPTRVTAGAPVAMTLRVENVAGRPLDLYLMGRSIAFDLIVEDGAGAEIWSRLHDQVLQQILRVEHLAPGDTLDLEDTWTQRSNDGSPVPQGDYRVRGKLFTEGDPLTAGPAPLRIAAD